MWLQKAILAGSRGVRNVKNAAWLCCPIMMYFQIQLVEKTVGVAVNLGSLNEHLLYM